MSGGNEEREKERDLKDNGKIGEERHLISQVFWQVFFSMWFKGNLVQKGLSISKKIEEGYFCKLGVILPLLTKYSKEKWKYQKITIMERSTQPIPTLVIAEKLQTQEKEETKMLPTTQKNRVCQPLILF